jgi:hypothetical protein
MMKASDLRSCGKTSVKPEHQLRLLFAFFVLVAANALNALAERALPAPQMTLLDNGEVRIGMDLALGGAVTFISAKDHPGNIINNADLGRQVQMSHYSGPWPFSVGEKKPRKEWAGLGWNPIQTGDCYGNPSRVVEYLNNGKEIYIKCIPMQWPLDNVPGDCVFETWTRLEGPVIHMRYRCTNQRSDKTVYRPCPQELPAVYTISKLWRLVSYTGDKPFTQDPLTQITNDWRKPWPWTHFVATERWAALVGEDDWGLGIFKDDGSQFDGGIYGDGRSEGPKDGSTAYVAPIHVETFDYNIVYEHRTDFMVGKLADMRKRFNTMATKTPPSWRFVENRQHWIARNVTDQGFPLKGAWQIKFGPDKPLLESAVQCWRTEGASFLTLKIAYTGRPTAGRILWKRLDDDNFDSRKSCRLDLVPDIKFHTYHVNLAASAEYRDLITGIAIEPVSQARSGEGMAIKSIVLSATSK